MNMKELESSSYDLHDKSNMLLNDDERELVY